MSRTRSAVLVVAPAGCSQSEPKAVPELPERICRGASPGPR
ncbi:MULTISPECIES: hypothetical protein [unclassified Streptomyces]